MRDLCKNGAFNYHFRRGWRATAPQRPSVASVAVRLKTLHVGSKVDLGPLNFQLQLQFPMPFVSCMLFYNVFTPHAQPMDSLTVPR